MRAHTNTHPPCTVMTFFLLGNSTQQPQTILVALSKVLLQQLLSLQRSRLWRAGLARGLFTPSFHILISFYSCKNLEQTLSLEVQSTTCSVSKERAGQGRANMSTAQGAPHSQCIIPKNSLWEHLCTPTVHHLSLRGAGLLFWTRAPST